MRMSFISVVVPALNSEKTVENCVMSLLNQKYPKNRYEIIFIDNGSTDNTLKILKKFQEKITILQNLKKGAYFARNKGIRITKGEIIAFIDSDCIADKNWILQIYMSFKNKHIKIVGGNIKALEIKNYIQTYYNNSNIQFLTSKSKFPFFGCGNMAIRKKYIKDTECFDTSLESGGDVELCYRIIKDKSEIYYEPKAIVKHLYSGSLFDFIEKSHYYGKWHKFREKKIKFGYRVQMPTYFQIIRKYGILFLFLRILQDASYNIGLFFGRVEN